MIKAREVFYSGLALIVFGGIMAVFHPGAAAILLIIGTGVMIAAGACDD